MLEIYFRRAKELRAKRRGPLAAHLDTLALDLKRRGYAETTATGILRQAGTFNNYARNTRTAPSMIDGEFAKRFLARLRTRGRHPQAEAYLGHFLRVLRDANVVPESPPPPVDPFASILAPFDRYLRTVRGLVAPTRVHYAISARRLLEFIHSRQPECRLETLNGETVLAHMTQVLELRPTRSWKSNAISGTRAFLRFLAWEGLTSTDLSTAVLRTVSYRLSTIPRHLTWKQAESLVRACDRSTPVGRRDHAVLMLLARCGLREGDVRRLLLADIDWRNGEVRLRTTKMLRERVLPLPNEVLRALADYALRGRPSTDTPSVFVKIQAPHVPLCRGAVGCIVRKYLKRVGIDIRGGAHLFRHGLATRMVNQGRSIKLVADVLGHRSIDSTAIYTKVDMLTLRAVAMPMPGAAT